jgi:hypothetical protein
MIGLELPSDAGPGRDHSKRKLSLNAVGSSAIDLERKPFLIRWRKDKQEVQMMPVAVGRGACTVVKSCEKRPQRGLCLVYAAGAETNTQMSNCDFPMQSPSTPTHSTTARSEWSEAVRNRG